MVGMAAPAGVASAAAVDAAQAGLTAAQAAESIKNMGMAMLIQQYSQSTAIGQQAQTEAVKASKRATDNITQAT